MNAAARSSQRPILPLRCRDNMAVATAVVFLHRFYAAKSLARNDPFVSLPPASCCVTTRYRDVWGGAGALGAAPTRFPHRSGG